MVGFRETRRAIDSVVDMPDRHANLFIKLCLQNNGRLSPAKRARHFAFLTDEEVTALEQAVQANLHRVPRPQGGDLDVK